MSINFNGSSLSRTCTGCNPQRWKHMRQSRAAMFIILSPSLTTPKFTLFCFPCGQDKKMDILSAAGTPREENMSTMGKTTDHPSKHLAALIGLWHVENSGSASQHHWSVCPSVSYHQVHLVNWLHLPLCGFLAICFRTFFKHSPAKRTHNSPGLLNDLR